MTALLVALVVFTGLHSWQHLTAWLVDTFTEPAEQ